MSRANLYLIKGFLSTSRKRLLTLNWFLKKVYERCQKSGFKYISLYFVQRSGDISLPEILINTTLVMKLISYY